MHDYGNRGLSGLALDPGFLAGRPYVYVLYTYDGPINGEAPVWGVPGGALDPCPDVNGAGCVVSARLSRFQATGNVAAAPSKSWSPTGSSSFPVSRWVVSSFGPDGALYASAGDGASATAVDFGQNGNPDNDPINEGGALRSQDLESPADRVTLDGAIVRLDPNTGTPLPRTTSMVVGPATVDANGVKSYPVTSAYQGSVPTIVRVLEPTAPAAGKLHRLLYVLPVDTGVTDLDSQYSDGLEELRLLDVPNRFNVTDHRAEFRASNRGTAITRAPPTVDWKATS